MCICVYLQVCVHVDVVSLWRTLKAIISISIIDTNNKDDDDDDNDDDVDFSS